MNQTNPLSPMLKFALASAKHDYDYFINLADQTELPEVKALLLVLAESESKMVDKIQHMILTGIVDELEELDIAGEDDTVPDATPIAPEKAETDPRIFVCNKVLNKSISSYTLYLRLATKAKLELISRLFEYLAHLKYVQISQLRRICQSY